MEKFSDFISGKRLDEMNIEDFQTIKDDGKYNTAIEVLKIKYAKNRSLL